ncbi:ABC transporter ATP-binding protein [Clostridium sp. P21]|uniref:ABC transporter ATP-binding protein n=1 Tax=Clostridium muellerianum TaxID=2716538 RepID=A0A7Y0HPV6_9CLOT|nr:ABC transporter ATP-binding protein [Clostridium muellerianum]NMM63421.1 ABC transporter ATP-binding protein [Clostridium muellerianum]
MSLLEVKNISVEDVKTKEEIVSNVSFKLESNTCLGIVGESGSGKSMTAKAILGLTNPWLKVSGSVKFDNMDLLKVKGDTIRKIRGKRICMILQDAMSAFDPLYTIGYQMIETLCENTNVSKKEAESLSVDALEKMCINEPEQVVKKYPHQLSGGMLQRCMIALSMSMKPDIIIADEPTTALDSINQREVVEEFKRLREVAGTAIIFISHDLGVVQYLAQDILVMKNGKCVEYGNASKVFKNPEHEYTKYLIDTRLELTDSFRKAMILEDEICCCK